MRSFRTYDTILSQAPFARIPPEKPVAIKMTNVSTIENQNAHTFLARQH